MPKFNASHKFTNVFLEKSQEEILNCPEFHAMTFQEITRHKKCPGFLIDILFAFPWKDRPKCIQVKPQDFRRSIPPVMGQGVHLDLNVDMRDGKARVAESFDDFRLMAVSFGDVAETQFASNVFEREDPGAAAGEYVKFFQGLPVMDYHAPKPNQLVEYTSRDFHKFGGPIRIGRARLLIVAIESNRDLGGGIVLPSILERG